MNMLITNTTEILQKGEKTLHAIGNSHTSQYLLINKNEACVLGHFYGKYTFTNIQSWQLHKFQQLQYTQENTDYQCQVRK